MTTYVGLLRAVNVGGTGKLPMTELRAMCEAAGFTRVRTYIQSGNVVFAADEPEKIVKATLERALEAYAGKPVGVMVRTGPAMAAILVANPWESLAVNRSPSSGFVTLVSRTTAEFGCSLAISSNWSQRCAESAGGSKEIRSSVNIPGFFGFDP